MISFQFQWFTTLRGQRKCGTIQGVKIWHLYGSTKPIVGQFANEAIFENNEYGAIISLKRTAFARIDKKGRQSDQLVQRISEAQNIYNGEYGIWIQSEKQDLDKLFSTIFEVDQLLPTPEFLLRSPNRDDLLKEGPISTSSEDPSPSTFLFFDAKSDPRLFESQFNRAKQNGIRGIAFDIEALSRGQLALAHKFNLETMLIGIKHERHEKVALESGADHLVVEIR